MNDVYDLTELRREHPESQLIDLARTIKPRKSREDKRKQPTFLQIRAKVRES